MANANRQALRPRGAVLIVTLLAMLLLAALVFYVLNLGQQVNHRILTQHGADSAGAAGAGWIARSMNTVAMNNIAISRHIASVNVLDSLPTATSSALDEQQFFLEQIRANQANSIPAPLGVVVNQQIDKLSEELAEEVNLLLPVRAQFIANDVTLLSHYQSSAGEGRLWQAMRALDQVNQATMQNLGTLAQVNAARGGQVNLEHTDAHGAALLLPTAVHVPYLRGRFADFERPVKNGLLPDAADHMVVRRGPYDTVFGWRTARHDDAGPGTRPPDPDPSGGVVGGDSPFGGGPGNHAGRQYRQRQQVGYYTYGTQGQSWRAPPGPGHALRQLRAFTNPWPTRRPNLRYSRYYTWAVRQADVKLNYIWPDGGFPFGDHFAKPHWSRNYGALPPVDQPLAFSECAYFRLQIKSRYPRGSAQFLTNSDSWWYEARRRFDGTYRDEDSMFEIIRRYGWWLPTYIDNQGVRRYRTNAADLPNVIQVGARTWLFETRYEVLFDREIGIEPADLDGDGNMDHQPAYFYQVVIFAGVNENPIPAGPFRPAEYASRPGYAAAMADASRVERIANPYDGFDAASAEAPAPIDLDHSRAGYFAAQRAESFNTLAIARHHDRALMWPSRFNGDKPYPYMVAVAQFNLFNDHSWDLWTPMWQAQMQPVRQYPQWVAWLDDAVASGSAITTLSNQELAELDQYLRSTEPLAALLLNH